MYTSTLSPTPRQVCETAPRLRLTAQVAAKAVAELARPRLRIATWLTPREQLEADAAGYGHILFTHCPALDAVRTRVRRDEVDAVLVSAALLNSGALVELGALVRDFPAVVFAGVVAAVERGRALRDVQMLGNAGVRVLVDCQRPGGWSALREQPADARLPEPFMRKALATVFADLEGGEGGDTGRCADGCRRFFRTIFLGEAPTVLDVTGELGVAPQTFATRFTRAGLPSPRLYFTGARLVRAAYLAETPGFTVTAIAERIGISSPQSFSRTLRHTLGITGWEFRQTYTGRRMLDRFRTELILPYRDTLRTFDPVAGTGSRRQRVAQPAAAVREVLS